MDERNLNQKDYLNPKSADSQRTKRRVKSKNNKKFEIDRSTNGHLILKAQKNLWTISC